jgi:hypothetical protein
MSRSIEGAIAAPEKKIAPCTKKAGRKAVEGDIAPNLTPPSK